MDLRGGGGLWVLCRFSVCRKERFWVVCRGYWWVVGFIRLRRGVEIGYLFRIVWVFFY